MRELVVSVRAKVDKLKSDIKSAVKGIAPRPIKDIGKKGVSTATEGISMKMLGKIGAMLGVLAIIGRAILSLKPIQAILEIINKILQMFFLPFAMMLFKLLKPALVWLLKLMMMWIRFWKDPIGNLKKIGEAIIKGIGDFFSGIGEGVGKFADWVTGEASNIWDKIKSYGSQAWEVLKGFGKWLWNGIVSSLSTAWEFLKKFGDWIWNTITTLIKSEINIIRTIGSWIWNLIVKSISNNINILKTFGKWLWDIIINIFSTSIKNLAKFGEWLWNAVTSPILSGLNILSKLGKIILDWAVSKIKGVGGFISNIFKPKEENKRPWNIKPITVKDMIVTPNGRLIQTNPQDYLIATKNPTAGNTFNIHITLNREEENISRQITRALTHELSRYGRW